VLVDGSPRLGSDAEKILICHTFIAGQLWNEVLTRGKAAIRALSISADDEDPSHLGKSDPGLVAIGGRRFEGNGSRVRDSLDGTNR